MSEQGEVTTFACGGRCPKDGKPHVWDGPEARSATMTSVTCSKCGLAAIDYDTMSAP
jgi:hypothetical protein